MCNGGCTSTNVCVINCIGDGSCDGATIECPDQYACQVVCDGVDACDNGTLVCPPDQSCSLVCQGGNDACGSGYALLRFDPSVDVSGLLDAAASRRVPFTLLDVPPGRAGDIYRHRLLISRPDQHVAWRGDRPPAASRALIDRLRGAG